MNLGPAILVRTIKVGSLQRAFFHPKPPSTFRRNPANFHLSKESGWRISYWADRKIKCPSLSDSRTHDLQIARHVRYHGAATSRSLRNSDHSVYIEKVLCMTFLRPFTYWPWTGIVKNRKFGVRSKYFLFYKTVQIYENRSADICLLMQAVGQEGNSLSM